MASKLSFNKETTKTFRLNSIYFKHKHQNKRNLLQNNNYKSSFFLAPAPKQHFSAVPKYADLCSVSSCSILHKPSLYKSFATITSKKKLRIYKHRWKSSLQKKSNALSLVSTMELSQIKKQSSKKCMTNLFDTDNKHQDVANIVRESDQQNNINFHEYQPISIRSISTDSTDLKTIKTN